jgi:hypothetical protein
MTFPGFPRIYNLPVVRCVVPPMLSHVRPGSISYPRSSVAREVASM